MIVAKIPTVICADHFLPAAAFSCWATVAAAEKSLELLWCPFLQYAGGVRKILSSLSIFFIMSMKQWQSKNRPFTLSKFLPQDMAKITGGSLAYSPEYLKPVLHLNWGADRAFYVQQNVRYERITGVATPVPTAIRLYFACSLGSWSQGSW